MILCGGTKDTQSRDIARRRNWPQVYSSGMISMTVVTRPFNAANYLAGPDDEADLLSDAIASGDPRYIAAALGSVARAHGGISGLARNTGLHRQTLHKALSENGNPTLDTVLKVLDALGLTLKIERRELETA